jgi:hypothetical protein
MMGEAKRYHDAGRLDQSVATYRSALAELSEREYRGSPYQMTYAAKTNLAVDLYARNRDGDRMEAADILRSIIVDTSAPAYYRASTVNNLIGFYNQAYDADMAKKIIFSKEPLSGFLKNGNVDIAMRRAYAYSYSLYPLPISAFRVALWHGNFIDGRKGKLTPKQVKGHANTAMEWLKKGKDAEMGSDPYNDRPVVEKAYAYQVAGMAYSLIGQASQSIGDDSYKRQYLFSEESFKTGLKMIAPEEESINGFQYGLMLRYYYALMLAKGQGGQGRAADITNLLVPIMHVPGKFSGQKLYIDQYLSGSRTKCKENLALLDGIVSNFSSVLQNRGVVCSK